MYDMIAMIRRIMMKTIKQHDKRTNITYVYEAESYWDKEAKQMRYKGRRLIGHIDSKTGAVVPNRPTRPSAAMPSATRKFVGATALLDLIAEETGLTDDLARAFPDTHKALMSVAYYMVCEDRCPLTRFNRWADSHVHPFGEDIPSQRASELFASVQLAETERLFALRAARQHEKGYWFYDTTSISSYSEMIPSVRWGKNKDKARLPQINLALVFGQESGLPVYFRRLPGEISDVSIVKELLSDCKAIETGKMRFCMDRGFYSKKNIDALMAAHMKFLIGVKVSLSYVREALRENRDTLHSGSSYDADRAIYGLKVALPWEFEQEHVRAGTVKQSHKRSYLHIYYSPERAISDEESFSLLLRQLATELEGKTRTAAHTELYERYFTMHRGRAVGKETAIAEAREGFGYFALLTNDAALSTVDALSIYRRKDAIEKAFADVKDRLDFRTPKVSSEATLQGKLLCVFLSLVLVSWLKSRMAASALYEKYTVQGLIDKVDTIERYERAGSKPRICTLTEKQRDIFEKLGFVPLSMS
jgi:transposase